MYNCLTGNEIHKMIYTMTSDSAWDEMILWNEWGELKCLQKPTIQVKVDGGLFPDRCTCSKLIIIALLFLVQHCRTEHYACFSCIRVGTQTWAAEPTFDAKVVNTNITAVAGQNVILQCSIDRLGKYKVPTWCFMSFISIVLLSQFMLQK